MFFMLPSLFGSFTTPFVDNSSARSRPQLTLADVCEQLVPLRGNGWKVDYCGNIRDKDGRCPLVAIAFAKGVVPAEMKTAFSQAVGAMGFTTYDAETSKTCNDVVAAADGDHTNKDYEFTRTQLCAALDIADTREVRRYYEDIAFDSFTVNFGHYVKELSKKGASYTAGTATTGPTSLSEAWVQKQVDEMIAAMKMHLHTTPELEPA